MFPELKLRKFSTKPQQTTLDSCLSVMVRKNNTIFEIYIPYFHLVGLDCQQIQYNLVHHLSPTSELIYVLVQF